jgi:hypothetical protein
VLTFPPYFTIILILIILIILIIIIIIISTHCFPVHFVFASVMTRLPATVMEGPVQIC